MVEYNIQRYPLSELKKKIKNEKVFSGDFIVGVGAIGMSEMFHHPSRIDAISIGLCIEGEAEISINLQKHIIKKNCLFLNMPENIVSTSRVSESGFVTGALVASMDYIRNIKIDFSRVVRKYILIKEHPILQLTDGQSRHVQEMLHMINDNEYSDVDINRREISEHLITALMLQTMQYAESYLQTIVDDSRPDMSKLRRNNYVKDFLSMLNEHHYAQRTLAFYAERLCISSKYLSRLVQQNTGRSAADWIDDYVILEAKNMLRYSSMNIQQVAYHLNFSTQSAFGKYFKHLTGMSPSQYQNMQ